MAMETPICHSTAWKSLREDEAGFRGGEVLEDPYQRGPPAWSWSMSMMLILMSEV